MFLHLDLMQNYLTLDLCSGAWFCTCISSTAFQMCLTCQVPVWRLLLPLSKIWICFCFFDFSVVSVLFCSQWCPQSHPDWAWAKKAQVSRLVDSHGCQNSWAWLWGITLFSLPQSHGDSPVWCHQRGQGKQNMGWGSSTILPAPPTKAESATFLSTNLPLLLSPSSFLPKSKNQICLHFWETRSFFFWCHETEALSALHFS